MRMFNGLKSLAAAVVLGVGVLGSSTGCVTNPATGKSSLNLISEEKEIAIGTDAEPQFIQENGGLVQSQVLTDYVSKLGHELAAVSERPHLPWNFNVLDSDQINAFALPGGKVFMSRGLLERMTNEAQLAGVLGHEVGHVTAQHVNSRMSQALIIQGIAIGTAVAGEVTDDDTLRVLGVGAGVGGGVYLLKFGRDQESESDMLGVRYMTRLGYNPYGQVQVMEILKEAQGGGGGAEFFSTHPLPQTRIDRLNKLIADQYPGAGRSTAQNDAYGQSDQFRFGEDSFKRNVLDELKKLPAPKAAQIGPKLRGYLAAVECGGEDHVH
ncbi:M48 family metallopeptidase [Algisphaera agarilytica]|uniref:Putative Zn-dependent protease n=1 Tax=Algisphaera agarilytica TaxID=1385975 RepID=A0A7X0LLK9_9BACT|nr:M48 family metallopeptidase [Algisphaera agarilytica]MBB6431117.1 putative Zn-dependent protease [Algisphaera agarilytica]